jgi:hypothetical protein
LNHGAPQAGELTLRDGSSHLPCLF